MTDEFIRLTRLYQSIAASVTRTEDYFSSEEFHMVEKSNGIACERIEPSCQALIKVLQGKSSGEDIGLPGIERKIAFYPRILKKQSKDLLASNLRDEIDDIIADSFLLGLTSHLYLYDNPSRNEFVDADAAAAMKKLVPALMSSSAKMRKYNRKLNTIPILMFEKYYDNNIAAVLNNELKLGILQCASARNYFTNLFFSGTRFGELLDNQMREVKE
jgi:hypothetical protein